MNEFLAIHSFEQSLEQAMEHQNDPTQRIVGLQNE
jgi:hypothetical protein